MNVEVDIRETTIVTTEIFSWVFQYERGFEYHFRARRSTTTCQADDLRALIHIPRLPRGQMVVLGAKANAGTQGMLLGDNERSGRPPYYSVCASPIVKWHPASFFQPRPPITLRRLWKGAQDDGESSLWGLGMGGQ